jgi:dolichol-phosphate mannosyltransferase subunit 3
MTRARRFAVLATLFTTLYFLAYLAIIPVPLLSEETKNEILPVVSRLGFLITSLESSQIPWWLLVSFGAYSLASLGWGLFTFRDCPDAYRELLSVGQRIYVLLIIH